MKENEKIVQGTLFVTKSSVCFYGNQGGEKASVCAFCFMFPFKLNPMQPFFFWKIKINQSDIIEVRTGPNTGGLSSHMIIVSNHKEVTSKKKRV